MKNCGKRFHSEVGKFRFLNELIKVVSPKVPAVPCALFGSQVTENITSSCAKEARFANVTPRLAIPYHWWVLGVYLSLWSL